MYPTPAPKILKKNGPLDYAHFRGIGYNKRYFLVPNRRRFLRYGDSFLRKTRTLENTLIFCEHNPTLPIVQPLTAFLPVIFRHPSD